MHAKQWKTYVKGHNQLYMRLRSCPMEHKQNLFSEVALTLKGAQLLGLQNVYYN